MMEGRPNNSDVLNLTVGDVMSRELVTLSDYEDMDIAGEIMQLRYIRHLPVVDEDGQLAGLVTHRDLLRVSVSEVAGIDPEERRSLLRRIPVRNVMRTDVCVIQEDAPLIEAGRQMMKNKFGCLPVIDTDSKLVGIVTEADFVELAVRFLELAGIQ